MFKLQDEMPTEMRDHVRDGKGSVAFTSVFTKEETFGKCRLMSVCTFEPGTSIGLHAHGPDAELYFMLEGEMTVIDDGVKKTIHPGDAVFTGQGKSHTALNESDKPAKLLAVVIE